MTKDIALNPETGDLYLTEFDLQLVKEIDFIEQSLRIRLRFFTGDWFLDTTAGIPFYSNVLIKNPSIPNIENILKARILETEGVTALLSFDISNITNREITVTFKVRTDYGIIDLNETLFPED
jgi:hypothetical protein